MWLKRSFWWCICGVEPAGPAAPAQCGEGCPATRRYPLWQFDSDGPDGVIDGLPDVLAALPVAHLIKARWLQRPQPLLEGHTPLQLLREGQLDRVIVEARAVGCGQIRPGSCF